MPKNCSTHGNIASSITIGAKTWNLTGPPLNISIPMANSMFGRVRTNGDRYYDESPEHDMWFYNEANVDLRMVKANSRCVAVDRYAWGFSASLILTFCVYTFAYAVCLVALQTEVYWCSRGDRVLQAQSLCGDILFLVRRLRSSLGLDIEDLSVEKLDERIKRYRRGLRLQVDELPNARYQQWQIDNPPPTTFRVYQKGVLRELHPEEKQTIADRFTSWKRRRDHQRAPQSGPHHTDEQDSSYELSPLPAQGCEEGQSTSVNSFVSRDGSNFEHADSISVLQTTASTDITATLRPVKNAVRERTANHSRE